MVPLHHLLLPCYPSMELIPSVPRDRATSAWEQRSKCLPLSFLSIFRACFNEEKGVGARNSNAKQNMKREKGNSEMGKKRMAALELNQRYLAQTWLFSRRGPGHEPPQLCFLSFLFLLCLFSRFPSLTRTQPICSEGRVTDGVDKPCSRAFPRDAPLPTTLSFLSQLLHGMWGAGRDAQAQLCETSFLSHICSATIH